MCFEAPPDVVVCLLPCAHAVCFVCLTRISYCAHVRCPLCRNDLKAYMPERQPQPLLLDDPRVAERTVEQILRRVHASAVIRTALREGAAPRNRITDRPRERGEELTEG